MFGRKRIAELEEQVYCLRRVVVTLMLYSTDDGAIAKLRKLADEVENVIPPEAFLLRVAADELEKRHGE